MLSVQQTQTYGLSFGGKQKVQKFADRQVKKAVDAIQHVSVPTEQGDTLSIGRIISSEKGRVVIQKPDGTTFTIKGKKANDPGLAASFAKNVLNNTLNK